TSPGALLWVVAMLIELNHFVQKNPKRRAEPAISPNHNERFDRDNKRSIETTSECRRRSSA
ncbi:MAG: hypothetical protein WCA23_21450, partial [Stellaceae bacterium]